jgi:DNA-binding CsgD family transcriptional regulator
MLMKHLIVFYYIICFSVGLTGNLVSILIYLKTKSLTAKYFLIFNFILTVLVITDTLYFYIGSIASYQNISLDTFFAWILFFCFAGSIYLMPYILDLYTGREFGLKKKIFFGILSLSSIGFILVPYLISSDRQKILDMLWFGLYLIYIEIFFAVIIYIAVNTFIRYKKTENEIERKVLKTVFALSVIFFPLFITDSCWRILQVNLQIIPRYFNFMPVFYFFWNLFIILYAVKHLFMSSKLQFVLTELPGPFIKDFQITDREKEVALLVLQGMNHHQISSKMFISTGTVRNYIYSIYQKTGVKNKLSLLNLIQDYLSRK